MEKLGRRVNELQQEIVELKQQPKPENATEEPDHSFHFSTSEVIETPSYKKLMDKFNLLEKEGKNGRNTLLILGPKGCGKTTSLMLAKEKLSEKYTVKYIDLGRGKLTNRAKNCDVLLLDNAQMYDTNWNIRYVIAAFSPGSSASTSLGAFMKVRGDGKSYHVFFTPIDRPLSLELL